jgi:hypothetical protein
MISASASAALLLAAFAVAAGPARADDAPAAETISARPTAGWSRQANSLLLHGGDGALTQELPLHEPDNSGASLTSRETVGGVAPDATMAWTLDRRLVWSPGRTKLLESHRLFRMYGIEGAELWRDESVDLPERGDAVLFSSDSKTLLLSRRSGDEWTAEARTWMGLSLGVIGPFPRLISMALTPNGRYALARWGVPDQSDTHAFVDLVGKTRRDVSSSDLVLGQARIGDDGVVRSGAKIVFSFEVAASSPPAVSSPTASSAPAPTP